MNPKPWRQRYDRARHRLLNKEIRDERMRTGADFWNREARYLACGRHRWTTPECP